jgi:N-acetyl-gamma-glutamyl-phosphate reductase
MEQAAVTPRVGVAGATGYAGAELVSLLREHPSVQLTQVSSRSQAGRVHREACLGSTCDLELTEQLDPTTLDVVISAQSVLEAAAQASTWLESGALVIDVSADFRLRDPELYPRWYGRQHPSPGLLPEAHLTVPELELGSREGRIVALPGCFATAAILAAAPALRSGLVQPSAVVDGKTGISGAGRGAGQAYLFSELDEAVLPYAVPGHRHQPEIQQALSEVSRSAVEVTFVPHLVPMTRGICVTGYLPWEGRPALDRVLQEYRLAYGDTPFVHLVETPVPTKLASRTNHTFIHLASQGSHLVVEAVLDNLGRGAAWQAVQALNWRLGLDPAAGIGRAPQWP